MKEYKWLQICVSETLPSLGCLRSSTLSHYQPVKPNITLSTCETEYVAATFSVCHTIQFRSLVLELEWPEKEPTTICMDYKFAIALSKNPVFHNRSKHIDTRFHYIRECVVNQEIHELLTFSQSHSSMKTLSRLGHCLE